MIALTNVEASLGGRRVLTGVSFEARAGQVTALCGPNGAGKSSALRAAVGLLPTSGGAVRLEGTPLEALRPAERAGRIAYLPQERRIAWNMSAVEIVALGLPFADGVSARVKALAALDEVEGGHLADRGVADMSGGERARTLIARVLASGASALALDEPTAGLDPDAALAILARLKARAAAGQAVLFSVHDLGLAARHADRIVVIDQGGVVADGPPEVALSPAVLGEVFRLDARWVEGPDGPLLATRRRRPQGA